jgi:hypothetical protein
LKKNDILQAAGAVTPDRAAVPRPEFRMAGIEGIQAAANCFGQSMLSFQQDDDPIPGLFHFPDDAPDGEDLIEVFPVEEGLIFIGEADQVGGIDGDGCCGDPPWLLGCPMIKIPI